MNRWRRYSIAYLPPTITARTSTIVAAGNRTPQQQQKHVYANHPLRKLRGQSQSTFRVRSSDRGMKVIAVPPAVHTRPRFNQAIRVLKDIGALERTEPGAWFPSSLGRSIMELGDAPKISLLDELRKGGYEASLITTFNAYLPFYEEVVLRRLVNAGVRHNVLLTDAGQYAHSLASYPPRPAGRHNTLMPVKVAGAGAFHPKLIFVSGKQKASFSSAATV